MPSTQFIYGHMASDIILVTNCSDNLKGNSLSPPHELLSLITSRQDSTYHDLCYTSCGTLAEREIAEWVYQEGSIRRLTISGPSNTQLHFASH